jgi:hypothetical protein
MLDEKTVLGVLDRVDNKFLIEVLHQRRYLALHFTLFCDIIICALEDETARGVAVDIVRAEYIGSNHREDFVREIMSVRAAMSLGSDRRDVVTHPISEESKRTVSSAIDLAFDAAKAESDLARLVTLHFFGEVTPSHEFKRLFLALERRKLLDRDGSVFLYPHVIYDELGRVDSDGEGALDAHAARYLSCIAPHLVAPGAWTIVEAWMRRIMQLRLAFYSQFSRPR